MSRTATLLGLLLVSCMPAGFLSHTPEDTQQPIDTDEPIDTDDPTDTGETDEPVDTGDTYIEPSGDIRELTWRLHDDMESLVWASWTQDVGGSTHVEFSHDGVAWHSTPTWELEAGSYEKLLVGIPFENTADWRVIVDGEYAAGREITTGDLPDGWPKPTVEAAEPDAWYPQGNYLLTSINEDSGGWMSGTYWTFIIDREGNCLWAQYAPQRHWTLFVQVAQSGDHFLWDEATYWSNWDNGAGSTVHHAYLDREIKETWTPGLHHAFVQLPDETLVWGSQYHGGGEALVEKAVDAAEDDDGDVIWTCDDDWPGSGHCESNGLFYQPSTDSFLYSFYTNNSLVEVDHSSGESLWWAGEVRSGYAFDPSDAQFTWQHGVSYTDEGHLMVSTHPVVGGNTTLVREYEVDHDARTLRQVWHYDAGVYASTNGDAWRLDNGNTLHLLGAAGEIKEVDAEGGLVWHVDWHASKLLGRGEFIEDLYTLVSPEAK
jgi:hypothetical protein